MAKEPAERTGKAPPANDKHESYGRQRGRTRIAPAAANAGPGDGSPYWEGPLLVLLPTLCARGVAWQLWSAPRVRR